MFPWVCPRVRVSVSVDFSVGMSRVSEGVSAGDSVDARGWQRQGVGAAEEVAMDSAVDIAVEIAVACAMASAMGLHGVPLLAAAFRASPWNSRGSPWNIRGCTWHAVDMSVERRRGPWTLRRSSAIKTNNVHPSHFLEKAVRYPRLNDTLSGKGGDIFESEPTLQRCLEKVGSAATVDHTVASAEQRFG